MHLFIKLWLLFFESTESASILQKWIKSFNKFLFIFYNLPSSYVTAFHYGLPKFTSIVRSEYIFPYPTNRPTRQYSTTFMHCIFNTKLMRTLYSIKLSTKLLYPYCTIIMTNTLQHFPILSNSKLLTYLYLTTKYICANIILLCTLRYAYTHTQGILYSSVIKGQQKFLSGWAVNEPNARFTLLDLFNLSWTYFFPSRKHHLLTSRNSL